LPPCSIAALLDPAQRPPRFLAGGHALDFGVVGLRLAPGGGYPEGYRPYSVPRWTDTSKAGRGNDGHLFGAELLPAERAALIEYLKLL